MPPVIIVQVVSTGPGNSSCGRTYRRATSAATLGAANEVPLHVAAPYTRVVVPGATPSSPGSTRRGMFILPCSDSCRGWIRRRCCSTIPVTVESVCVHGDSPGAVQIANAVRDRLVADGVQLKAFI